MVSTVIPLIKDKLGDVNSSNNYRSIALSSLILKVFDWTVLMLYGENLRTDELQFGFQEKTSTNMCTWLAIETIDYYTRNGSEVFVGVMDMTKAFDNVKQSVLFRKLIDRGVPSIYLRLLLNMYSKQTAHVHWNGKVSNNFSLSNGVKQGGVLSPRLYCVYTDELFALLRRKRTGCWVEESYVGILGYADDLLLLSPSRDGLQEMMKTCEKFMTDLNLSFSTHVDPKKCKTKCMAYLNNDREVRNITLNGKDLPWVKTAKHLGCKIDDTQHGGLHTDLMEKRAIFINKVNELSQEFHFAHPLTKIRINNIFNSYFYGSGLWDLFGKEAARLEKTWNVSQRIMLGVPRNTHRYFIEPLSDTRHAMLSIYRRYIKFVKSIEECSKPSMRNMLDAIKTECRSNTGRNLRKLMYAIGKTSIDDLEAKDINNLTYNDVPPGAEWKINMAREIIDVKNGDMDIDLSSDEIGEILIHVVT